jgi:hypothetical protein
MLFLGACVVGLSPAPRTVAKDERTARKAEALPSDLELVAGSGGSFITIRVADALDSEVIKNLPPIMKRDLNQGVTFMESFFGVDASNVERVSIPIVSYHVEPPYIVRTIKPFDKERVMKAIGDGAKLGPTVAPKLHIVDDRTFVVGRPKGVEALLAKAGAKDAPRPHALAATWAAERHHVVVGGKPADLGMLVFSRHRAEAAARDAAESELRQLTQKERDFRKDEKRPPEKEEEIAFRPAQEKTAQEPRAEADLTAEMLAELPAQALPYKPLLQAKSGAIAIDLGAESRLQCQFVFPDEDAARDGEAATRILLYVGRELLPQLGREMRVTRQSSPKFYAILDNAQGSLRAAKVERRGTDVTASVAVRTDAATMAVFGEEVEKAASRQKARHNLMQMALAMHAHHDVYNGFPASAIYDPTTGKPLLSWRVAILPFIEEENLYKQFKLNEPWDSPNNMKLIEKMPKIYLTPGGDVTKGQTHYRVFVGPGTVFPAPPRPGAVPPGTRIFQITDGSSNTLLIVEAANAVTWTKPDELEFDAKKPLPKLGHQFPEGFLAAFADGAVRLLDHKKIDEATLRNLIQIADGNVVDWDKIEPNQRRFGPGSAPSVEPARNQAKPPDVPRGESKPPEKPER